MALSNIEIRQEAYALLGTLQKLAPDGPAQKKCTNLFNDAEKDGATGRDLLLVMADTLSDGLHRDNWPWTPSE